MSAKANLSVAVFVTLFGGGGGAYAADYQDWWGDMSKDGMGFNIGQQGDTMAVAWYHFDSDRSATYNLLSGKLVNGVLTGQLQEASGPPPGPAYNPADVLREFVGTATLRFTSPTSAVFEYTLNGQSGTFNLTRFTMQDIPLAGSFQFASLYARSNCLFPSNEGQIANSGFATMEKTGTTRYSLRTQSNINLDSCNYDVDLVQSGSVFTGSGQFSCINGRRGNITVNRLQMQNSFLSFIYTAKYSVGESCNEVGRLSGVQYGSFDAAP